MMSTTPANMTASNWPESNRWPPINEKEPVASTEIQKLNEDIEKEEDALKEITREFANHLSSGEQDMAKLKSVQMQQKQMQIQAIRLQIDKLENPEQADGASQAQNTRDARPKYDEYIPSNGDTNEIPGLYRLETDESGNQKIIFTPPEAAKAEESEDARPPAAENSEPEGADSPEEEKPERYRASARLDPSEVRAEIAKIKQQRAALAQQLGKSGGDDEARKSKEAQLARIDAELAMKDNPEYIKRNAKKTYGPAVRES